MKKPKILEIRLNPEWNETGKITHYNNGIFSYITKFIVRLDDKTDTHINVDMVSSDPDKKFYAREIIECAYIQYNEMWS